MTHAITIISDATARRAADMVLAMARDGKFEVCIRQKKSRRSIDQNSLHWKRLDVLRLHIADSTGQIFSAEELHEFFKTKLLPVHLVEIGGESVKVRRTTTKMSTKEFSEFMDAIDRYCIERLNLYLPVPGLTEE
jgi:hypothetical protein